MLNFRIEIDAEVASLNSKITGWEKSSSCPSIMTTSEVPWSKTLNPQLQLLSGQHITLWLYWADVNVYNCVTVEQNISVKVTLCQLNKALNNRFTHKKQ